MPRLSGDTLLQRAIPSAVQDRISLADSYARGSAAHAQFMAQSRDFEGLTGKKLAALTEEERRLAFEVLVCAEQWEDSVADANHDRGAYAKACRRAARLYRDYRLAEFGRTALEAALVGAKAVGIHELRDGDTRPF